MILEALHFTLALAFSKRRKLKEIASSVSLWSRAKRCKKAWAQHEENCKAFIEEKSGQLMEHRTVAVLGSGLLDDIPLTYLASHFRRVELYDRVHLPSARWRVRQEEFTDVFFIERDLSEGLDFLKDVKDLDLVISANLVSQMALANRKDTAKVVEAHIAGLLAGPWTPCLITDISFRVLDRQGNEMETGDLLAGHVPPPAFKAWEWTVAPFGEEDKDLETIHHVIAV